MEGYTEYRLIRQVFINYEIRSRDSFKVLSIIENILKDLEINSKGYFINGGNIQTISQKIKDSISKEKLNLYVWMKHNDKYEFIIDPGNNYVKDMTDAVYSVLRG